MQQDIESIAKAIYRDTPTLSYFEYWNCFLGMILIYHLNLKTVNYPITVVQDSELYFAVHLTLFKADNFCYMLYTFQSNAK